MDAPAAKASSPSLPDPAVAREALAELGRILRRGLGEGATILLFGSWARGTATRLSDIDVAVLPSEPLTPQLLAQLRDRIEESRVPYRVDVVDLSSCEPAFRERVLLEAVVWSA